MTERTVGDMIRDKIAALRANGFVMSEPGDLGDECDSPIYALAGFANAFVDFDKKYKRVPRLLWRFPIEDGQKIEIRPQFEDASTLFSVLSYGVRIPYRVGFDGDDKAGWGGEFRGFIDAVDHYVALRRCSALRQRQCELSYEEIRSKLESLPVIEWLVGLLTKLAGDDVDVKPGGDLAFSHCMFCGKALTVPESVYCGFGPECGKRLGWNGKVQVSDAS